MPRTHLALPLVALIVAAVTAAPARAVTAPRSCGYVTVKGVRYMAKVDQISCATGKPYVVDYLRRGRRPTGFICRRYDRRATRQVFACQRGKRVFLAIRRSSS